MVYYKTSGIYQRSVKYLSTLYRYDWLLIPYIDDGANVNKALADFAKASRYYDNSYIPKICGEIALKTIINGIYYGYALDNGDGLAIQELPIEYCRSRFSANGNPIVEFNMKYFDKAFPDIEYRVKILNVFPQEFSKGYLLYKQGKLPPQFQGDTEGWYMLDAGGAFKISCGHEDFPLLITAIPAIIDLDNAKELDRQKTMQKLLKIFVQKLPFDKNGNLIFDLDEAKDLHNNAVAMMKKAIGAQVLTTFADVESIDMSDSNSNTTANDDLKRIERAVFNELGVSQGLFNAEGNLGITNSIVNDEASVKLLIQSFQQIFNKIIAKKFNSKKYSFRFRMLETTIYNYKDLAKMYKEQTQIGFSKVLPQIALGHSQSEILALAHFENDVLNLNTVMIPPLSSNTANSETILGKTGKNTTNESSNNSEEKTPGRPEKDDSEKSDKTLANRESM